MITLFFECFFELFCSLNFTIASLLLFVFLFCLEFQIIRFVISTFTLIFFIEISFVLPPPPGKSWRFLSKPAQKPKVSRGHRCWALEGERQGRQRLATPCSKPLSLFWLVGSGSTHK